MCVCVCVRERGRESVLCVCICVVTGKDWTHPLGTCTSSRPETLQLPTLTVGNVSARGAVIVSSDFGRYFRPCLFLIASPNMEAGMSSCRSASAAPPPPYKLNIMDFAGFNLDEIAAVWAC